VRDDDVYVVRDHDRHRTQLPSPITEHVRHAAMGQYTLLRQSSASDVVHKLTYLD